mmetsp:Transcript_39392/g.66136  ORF Transcript_39392/g.66136 Transcript_39392/m.66136 type:complete len:202 (+) Transcript_39392:78-683(+)
MKSTSSSARNLKLKHVGECVDEAGDLHVVQLLALRRLQIKSPLADSLAVDAVDVSLRDDEPHPRQRRHNLQQLVTPFHVLHAHRGVGGMHCVVDLDGPLLEHRGLEGIAARAAVLHKVAQSRRHLLRIFQLVALFVAHVKEIFGDAGLQVGAQAGAAHVDAQPRQHPRHQPHQAREALHLERNDRERVVDIIVHIDKCHLT